jgi:DNA invertase Pin-like site-specific DNA recombinase
MIAAIYARKSTDDSDRDAEARSTRRQIDSATQYAAAKGWTVDPRFVFVDENTSGAEWKHCHGWTALWAALEETPPPFGVVIVSGLSRIGRRTARTLGAIEQVEDAGVEIHSYLSRAPITLADEAGEMSTVFGSLLASRERRLHRDRAIDTARRRFDAGAVTGARSTGTRTCAVGRASSTARSTRPRLPSCGASSRSTRTATGSRASPSD